MVMGEEFESLMVFQPVSLILKTISTTRSYLSRREYNVTILDCIMSAAIKGGCEVVKEGKAEVLFTRTVFYNPVQEFNRDLSVSVIRMFTEEFLNSKGIKVSFAENMKEVESVHKEMSVTEGEGQHGQGESTTTAEGAPEEEDGGCGDPAVHAGVKCEEGIHVLEALAASGLRSIRYAKEIPGVKNIITNDIAAEAVEAMKRNIAHNHLEAIVNASQADACLLMYQNPSHFDVIDLDPYGCAAQFIDPSVHAVRPGGLLCVTCTDMTVLCGNYGETCFTKYGAYSVKATYSHEMALRILLYTLQASATRCSRYIEPLLSVSADFYIRVFVRVHSGQAEAKHSARKTAVVYICTYCENFSLQRFGQIVSKSNGNTKFTAANGPTVPERCDNCGGRYHISGPMWAEPLHNRSFVNKLLEHVKDHNSQFNTAARLEGLLTVISEEVPNGTFYYPISKFCNFIRAICPSQIKVRSAIMNAGYQVSGTHCSAEGIKTDAPPSVVWDILRAWEKENPVKREKLPPQALHILEKGTSINVSFELHPDANPPSRNQKLRRFQQNPEKYWGPKKKAGPVAPQESLKERKHRRQGKRSRQEDGKPETGAAEVKPNEKALKTDSLPRQHQNGCEKRER
ncbi:tRNA (guanine(26)-N(2))-dimethyltransferase-like isoform X3 [Apostichopus japonicus]|uniref:tRNA (guanine(26)-N(2))-dimethyltransferase-like isoform X3 n=1 Tax=Stichopus japonicus TaxID=307972 RepID=UPI003AB2A065